MRQYRGTLSCQQAPFGLYGIYSKKNRSYIPDIHDFAAYSATRVASKLEI
jgi:hypothetical protein